MCHLVNSLHGRAWELFRVLLETDLPGLTDFRAPPQAPGLPGPDGNLFFFFFPRRFCSFFESRSFLFLSQTLKRIASCSFCRRPRAPSLRSIAISRVWRAGCSASACMGGLPILVARCPSVFFYCFFFYSWPVVMTTFSSHRHLYRCPSSAQHLGQCAASDVRQLRHYFELSVTYLSTPCHPTRPM